MIEYNIKFYRWRCSLHLIFFRVLWGCHRIEGWYFKIVPPLWWYSL